MTSLGIAMPSRKPAAPKTPPVPARRPRRPSVESRQRIMDQLITGLPVIRIARAEGLTVRRVRQIIAEMLAKRELDPAAGFVQIQIARLSEAMAIAHELMLNGDLAAMDRFVKLASELDRYHGFVPGRPPASSNPEPPRLAPPEAPRLANAAPKREIFLPTSD